MAWLYIAFTTAFSRCIPKRPKNALKFINFMPCMNRIQRFCVKWIGGIAHYTAKFIDQSVEFIKISLFLSVDIHVCNFGYGYSLFPFNFTNRQFISENVCNIFDWIGLPKCCQWTNESVCKANRYRRERGVERRREKKNGTHSISFVLNKCGHFAMLLNCLTNYNKFQWLVKLFIQCKLISILAKEM